ncbi:DUF6491 family protein [Thermomonas sp. HDW16]|uniref:DUF6491 family protein n=1 Tax=Thermomonas sp. HDW16 TaxID=2714945 RepID=UPI00140C1E0F|nr:DUF6491 family protein [Thermomonas sp. HDW16]QIL20105.1 hypothetical protein G7079_04785 [Thermomonas sp. HDW16]
MKALMIPLLVTLGLAACATNRPSDADRLAMYQAHAGAPVKQIRNDDPISWDRIDDQHVLLTTRPSEAWLLTVSGSCLDWGSASPVMVLSSTGPYVTKFDHITIPGSPMSCQIREMQPIDVKAVRAAEAELRAQASAGT